MRTAVPLCVACLLILPLGASAEDSASSLGFRQDTEITEGPGDDEICPEATLLQNDDGSFESAYMWRWGEVSPPDYGSWAEHYDCRGIICGLSVGFTTIGYQYVRTLDVYVWEDDAHNPGNALIVVPDWDPGPILFWPSVSFHDVEVGEVPSPGPHFIGFWPNWPGHQGWYLGADEDGPGLGSPRTKIAPGLGYPTGWNHPVIVPQFSNCRDLAIREYCIEVPPTAARKTTWGRIKSLY
jgi:hypothetical protein